MLNNWIKKYFNTQVRFIFLVTAFIMLTGNYSLFSRIADIYSVSTKNLIFLVSLGTFFSVLTAMFFIVISHGRTTRWTLAIFLIIASQSAYYMDKFGVIVDIVMIDNIAQTNAQEFAGLFSISLLLRTLFLGAIPAWFVIKYCPNSNGIWPELKTRLIALSVLVLSLILVIAPFSLSYATFLTEHKITRFYANPTYTVYSALKYLSQEYKTVKKVVLKHVAHDAVMLEPKAVKKELIIMVVGETARYDRFSINGYHRETNPMLAKQDIISFSRVSSCGTSTSVSVPCMFSALTRKEYSKEKALNQENALDILFDHGVQILWRDNNSDSKGVATRVPYEDFRSPTLNPNCEGECRDIGMLAGLKEYIEARKGKDILIVLHQLGNHGPRYYQRYPKAFARFQPECMSGDIQACSQEAINNSYDNAILYTDYFLSNVIDLLKQYDHDHSVAMLYMSDHGESLGENGVYLHAAPYSIAPKEQTHVPAIMWIGQYFDYKKEQLIPYQDYALSHDDLFCSLLVAFEVETKVCEAKHKMLMENIDIKNALNKPDNP